MRSIAWWLLGVSSLATAAALVPPPNPTQPVSISEIQPNRGQAAAGILFQTRGTISIAAQGASLLVSPVGGRQNFLGGNSNPQVSFSDPLPGVSHDYSTGNRQRWITNIPRYATAHLAGMYPGIDVEYTFDSQGQLTMRLFLAPGADLRQMVFEFPETVFMNVTATTISVQFLEAYFGPNLIYGPAVSSTPVTFEQVSYSSFRLSAPLRDQAASLRIDFPMALPVGLGTSLTDFTRDGQSNLWAATAIPDAAGKSDPFVSIEGNGCGVSIGYPIACNDVAVYKVSPAGVVLSVSYFSGGIDESPAFLGIASDGSVVVTGTTNSSDFPVSVGAYQAAYAGPAAIPIGSVGRSSSGDYFAVRLDPATGALRASTYFGGPKNDRVGETVLGADGSVYFLHKSLTADYPGLPTSPGALMRQCADVISDSSPCLNGYVAHLSNNLDQLLFGTYVPGAIAATMRVHSDGSVYFSGSDSPSFQPTPGAYQSKINGPHDAVVGRLDPTGSKLLFGTYIGGPNSDYADLNAVSPDGSIWVHTTSIDLSPGATEHHLIRLDGRGEHKLVELAIDAGDLATDRDGNVLATTPGPFAPSPDALVSNPCPGTGYGYAKIDANGKLGFFTYLPRPSNAAFYGTGPDGLPLLIMDTANGSGRFEIVEGRNMGVFGGCMVDSGQYRVGDSVSPGEIVTIFGSQMGPAEGVAFSLDHGRIPTSLGGTQVLVNQQPIPLLYVSKSQINAVLPFDLPPQGPINVVVKTGGTSSSTLPASYPYPTGLSLFSLDGSGRGQAAAINEDGSVNSPQHPAKAGSRVMLFGTGGGQTDPPSTAGDVTPLEIHRLVNPVRILVRNTDLPIEFAGSAPGLVSGVNQINVRLPDPMPKLDGYPSGTLPLDGVTLSVSGN